MYAKKQSHLKIVNSEFFDINLFKNIYIVFFLYNRSEILQIPLDKLENIVLF